MPKAGPTWVVLSSAILAMAAPVVADPIPVGAASASARGPVEVGPAQAPLGGGPVLVPLPAPILTGGLGLVLALVATRRYGKHRQADD